ncbi:MAG: hypothetical protein U1E65_27680 [Myxococcota bacterium]
MSLRACIGLVALLAACAEGGRAQPGEGVLLEGAVVALDPAVVPVLPSCPSGQAIRRQGPGFVCAPVSTDAIPETTKQARAAELAALGEEITRLGPRIAAVTSTLSALEGLRSALGAARQQAQAERGTFPLAVAAIACARNANDTSNRRFTERGGMVYGADRTSVDAHIYCPFFIPDPNVSWNSYDLLGDVRDEPNTDFRNAIYALDAAGRRHDVGSITASRYPIHGFGAARTSLFKLQEVSRMYFHSDDAVYASLNGLPTAAGFAGLRTLVRGPAEAPELAAVGGVLRIDIGAARPGSQGPDQWLSDEIYLAPDQPETSFLPPPGQSARPVDVSAVAPEIPASVFVRDRRCDCPLHYQLAVPSGRYSVLLAFAENCTSCTSIDTDGILGPEIRSLRVQIEGQVDVIVPADAAVPPADDGRGAYDVAAAKTYQTTVTDGVLDITVAGGSGPAILSAMVIRRLE